mmetsp:Transcript_37380/g.94311  ORF Transcript_37380/g.94311 Transcript_37380/m.94311 type:complete len:228 (-) Transcript_37380:375-1058(-)
MTNSMHAPCCPGATAVSTGVVISSCAPVSLAPPTYAASAVKPAPDAGPDTGPMLVAATRKSVYDRTSYSPVLSSTRYLHESRRGVSCSCSAWRMRCTSPSRLMNSWWEMASQVSTCCTTRPLSRSTRYVVVPVMVMVGAQGSIQAVRSIDHLATTVSSPTTSHVCRSRRVLNARSAPISAAYTSMPRTLVSGSVNRMSRSYTARVSCPLTNMWRRSDASVVHMSLIR